MTSKLHIIYKELISICNTSESAFILPYKEESIDFCARDYHVVRVAVNFITKNYSLYGIM